MDEYRSIPEMFFAAARRGGETPRFLTKQSEGGYAERSWALCRTSVLEFASALLGIRIGVGERVAILSSTRREWVEADLAVLSIGCVTIPIYPSNLASECGYLLRDSEARIVFAENPAQARKLFEVTASGIDVGGEHHDVHLDHVILFDGECEGCLTIDAFLQEGRQTLSAHEAEIAARGEAIQKDSLATIVYTSGTTGLPKGVMQSHGNHLAAIESVGSLGMAYRGEIDFAFLPLAHSFGRMMEYLAISIGTVTAFAGSIDTLIDDVGTARPHLLPAVPRIYEKIYARVQQNVEQAGAVGKALFRWALSVGERRAEYCNRGAGVPAWTALRFAFARRFVLSKIHRSVGGRMRLMISGGAPLSPDIIRFFHAVGLPILEGYGLTETTPILTTNRPGNTVIGTVGPPVPGVEFKFAGDGEILAKGANVAAGYHHRPEETAAAWDQDGWFHTGDIGVLENGMLRITDRKKELIKTAGGKYVAPQKIENMLKSKPLISQAVLIGDRKKYCVALLTVDGDAVAAWAAKNGVCNASLEKLLDGEALKSAVNEQVEQVNAGLASYESVKYFRILHEDFSVEHGELTPSLKVKRKIVAKMYREEIDSMF